jgi:Sigma-70 region 2
MAGTIADAEDVVQESWLRWNNADQTSIERPEAWLTTVTARIAIDRIRATSRRREQYPGPRLPEPLVVDGGPRDRSRLVAQSRTVPVPNARSCGARTIVMDLPSCEQSTLGLLGVDECRWVSPGPVAGWRGRLPLPGRG